MHQGGEFDHCYLLFVRDAKRHCGAAVLAEVGEDAPAKGVPGKVVVFFLDLSRVAAHSMSEVHVYSAAPGWVLEDLVQ